MKPIVETFARKSLWLLPVWAALLFFATTINYLDRIVFSVLDDIPGIGERRKRELIRRFGSVRGVRAAAPDALAEVLGPRLAARVQEHLARHPDTRPAPQGVAIEPDGA